MLSVPQLQEQKRIVEQLDKYISICVPENIQKTPEEIEKAIVGEITAYGSTLNYKKIIIRLTREKSAEYRPMLDKYGFAKGFHNDTDRVRSLKNYIQFVYNFASMSSHVNREMQEEYRPIRENCLRGFRVFS